MKYFFKLLLNFSLGTFIGILYRSISNSDSDYLLSVKNIDLPKKQGFLLVSVLTTNNFIDKRSSIIDKTWALDYKHIFYFSQEKKIVSTLPVIFLPGTDDSYPPQKKSFTMLKFLFENYVDSYEWFLRADDDVYVKLDKLRHFLKSLDSEKHFYIGQPGLHKSLSTPYCMGGPSMIISKQTLKKVGPYLDYCFSKMIKSKHEDVEIGRCINKFVNITCTSAIEVRKDFFKSFFCLGCLFFFLI